MGLDVQGGPGLGVPAHVGFGTRPTGRYTDEGRGRVDVDTGSTSDRETAEADGGPGEGEDTVGRAVVGEGVDVVEGRDGPVDGGRPGDRVCTPGGPTDRSHTSAHRPALLGHGRVSVEATVSVGRIGVTDDTGVGRTGPVGDIRDTVPRVTVAEGRRETTGRPDDDRGPDGGHGGPTGPSRTPGPRRTVPPGVPAPPPTTETVVEGRKSVVVLSDGPSRELRPAGDVT